MKVEFTNNIKHFKEVESTNVLALNYIKENDLQSSVIFTADFQNFGRGQQLSKWESNKGDNLLISIALKMDLSLENQFNLCVNTSLSISDVLSYYNIENVSVKWPNDIVVKDKKICGILIENKVRGQKITHSVLGIGLNINQTKFKIFNQIATSFKLESNSDFDLHCYHYKNDHQMYQLQIHHILLQHVDNLHFLYHLHIHRYQIFRQN